MRVTGHDLIVTFVTTSLKNLSPRSSLTAGTVWLVIALAASFATAASLLAGRVAREIVVQQHMRRLALETDQLGSDLGQAVAARVGALRAVGTQQPGEQMFQRLTADFPDLGWIAVADAEGHILAGDGSLEGSIADQPWFHQALGGAWLGLIDAPAASGKPLAASAPVLGDLVLPLQAANGRSVGVIAARLTWRWADQDIERLSEALDSRGSAEMLIMDHRGLVLVGPAALRNRIWSAIADGERSAVDIEAGSWPDAPRFERQPNDQVALVARAPVSMLGTLDGQGWQVQLSEPKRQVYERADALAMRILWISICLAGITALVGALGAGRLTERLRGLTASAVAAGGDPNARLSVPSGNDEVARLGAAFAQVLDDLRQERRELLTLSGDLERRVAQRTREVERLAEESRYAAIVRERLKIARDLHDTLAHSMMAMLSEVRLLRKLQSHDPASLAEELANAEQVAHSRAHRSAYRHRANACQRGARHRLGAGSEQCL